MAFLRALHRWLGLLLAAIVFVVATSGGLLLLRDPYYRAVYPRLRAPISADQAGARAAILTEIESRWQTEGVRLVKFPRSGINAFQVWLGDESEAFVEPHGGGLIDRWHWWERLPAFLFELHAHLLVERSGTVINGVTALFVVFMALTGTVLWWPGRHGAFRLRGAILRHTTPGDLLRSHAAVGALALVPVVLFAATGAAIVFYEPVADVMSGLLDARPPAEPEARVTPRETPPRPWAAILAALDGTFPDGETVFFYPGTPTNARLMFRKRLAGEWHPNGRSVVLIDPYTGRVIQAIDARAQGGGTRLMHGIYPVHAAKVGGLALTALAAFTAVALTWLATGGAWAYLGRRAVVMRRSRVEVTGRSRSPSRRGVEPEA